MTAIRPPAFNVNLQDALLRNIEDHISCMQALVQTLAQEHEALLGSDPAVLEQVSASKSHAVLSLQQLSQNLSAIPGIGGGTELERSIQLAGKAVQQRWQHLLSLAAQCQQANLANGALLDAKQSQIKWALSHMLGTAQANTPTYGRGGIRRDDGTRRILASA